MSDSNIANRQRRGRRARGTASASASAPVLAPVGGRLQLLDAPDLQRIHQTALALLARTGIAEAPPQVVDLATAAGATLGENGRLCFPEPLVERETIH